MSKWARYRALSIALLAELRPLSRFGSDVYFLFNPGAAEKPPARGWQSPPDRLQVREVHAGRGVVQSRQAYPRAVCNLKLLDKKCLIDTI